jgi:hypothetical protein
MSEVKQSSIHGSGLFATEAYEVGDVVLTEQPLAVSTAVQPDSPLYTLAWTLTSAMVPCAESIASCAPLAHQALQWEDKDDVALKYLAEKYHKTRNDIYKLYATVASVNVRIRDMHETIAVYQAVSYLNHSCDANCICEYERERLQLRTLRNIKQHEELTIDFIEITTSKDISSDYDTELHTLKRQYLQQLYAIDCKCAVCGRENESTLD